MNLNLFAEINRTNKAYCASLGLPSDTYDRPLAEAETNGTPLSPGEAEIAKFMATGINREAAAMFAALNKQPAKPLTWNPRQRPAPAPHCVVEYGRREPSPLPDMDINAHMNGFGFRSGDRNWTGD